ncbi:unnamed protein product [Penicillium salamii]|uniref:DUF1479-domain-containing protein n=1 Tax=Penicillium salamii TaxID=1612424 RepID=A0A9W4INP2_9EURO|nr:unnamed protein product [Penicillium salamii]CAG8290591.1 unnamed protein product [Penicillium salamii]CAG8342795.1 unnamed protein product [Penicillium salamii]CAG8344668.1 unnamed protein product [Penicillium salamii]CAG8350971.1 unnamed protein product [Penicillium salamii]
MNRLVSPKCLRCPTFQAGKCSAATKRPLKTDATPLTRKDKQEGDISSVFSTFSGRKSPPLPDRFRDLKRNLTVGFEEEIQKSWDELVEVLKIRTEEVATKRESIIPQLNFADIQAGNVSAANKEAIRRTGVAVIRGVVPQKNAEALLADVRKYFERHPFKGFPADAANKVIYESYWSPSQVKARSHPNMLATQSWMNQFYSAAPDQKIDLSVPLTYCDRVQIRPPGDTHFGLPPHVDGGGVERWEDPAYSHVYRKIFQGKWNEYDPWDLTGRLDANMNMYEAPGGCSVFRAFQSWLGLSRHGPQEGTLVVHPILQPTTAYWMLRPFFKPTRKGSLDGWKFSLDDEEGQNYLHGANPGTAQEHTPDHHPHLRLQDTMIPYPTVEPGDTVFWSADTIHGTETVNAGDNDACVFYIPSVPLTPNNAQYIAQQRDAFLKGVPPPDFPGGLGETDFPDRANVKDIQSEAGRVAMGLDPVNLKGRNNNLEKEINDILFP